MAIVFPKPLPDDIPLGDVLCNFCGGQPSAYWAGLQVIGCCADCARERLPRLFADATLGRFADRGKAEEVLRRALGRFEAEAWHGAVCAIQACRQRRLREGGHYG